MKSTLLFLSLLFVTHSVRAAEVKRPNVLFIAIDDLRDWVGYLRRNEQTKTPNIDRLARMGVAFTHSYCAAPVCNPSRAALMSGMRPSTTGVYENQDDWRTVISVDKPLTAAFRSAGYFVCGAGKIYHESYERRAEWDDYQDSSGLAQAEKKAAKDLPDTGVGGIKFAPLDCQDSDMADYKITNYGIEQLGRVHDKPFFLAVGLHKPHMPWNVPQKWYDLFPLESVQTPPFKADDLADIPPSGVAMAQPAKDHHNITQSGHWKEAVRGYLAAIAYTDMNVGRLLDAYDRSPAKDNTIIVFFCDHGWHLGEKSHWRKFALWEEATRSPLLWVVPGLTKPGSTCTRTVDLMSIYPTLMELCHIPKPAHVEGVSLKPLLKNPMTAWSLPALTTHKSNNHAVRDEGWRYIRYANGQEELYDETADPNEWNNLAGDAAHADIKARLAPFMPKNNHLPLNKGRARSRKE